MRVPTVTGVVALVIAGSAAAGWVLGFDPLTSIVPGWATLKANTALCIGLLGISLLATPRWRGPLALLPAIVAALSLVEWTCNMDLGLDQLLVLDPASARSRQPPGRMAAATAIALMSTSFSVAATRSRPALAQAAAVGTLVVSWIAVLGYAYELGPLSSVWLYGTVSLPTAVALMALGLGALLSHPTAGWIPALTADDSGARLLRRLGPAAVLLPSFTGWLALQVDRHYAVQRGFAIAAAATLDALAFAALLAATAAGTRREEAARTRAENLVRSREQRLAELTRELLHAHEEERRSLAHELHDELGQTLTALGLQIDRAGRQPAALREAAELVQALTHDVRRLSLDLRPSLLDDLGLAPAVRWLVTRFPDRPITVTVDGDERRCPPAVETAGFRIVQESLTNAVRHASATRIAVHLHFGDPKIEVSVSDDGRGFDPTAAPSGRSVGLDGMRERAESVGGRLEVTSDSAGTKVKAILSE